jgi:hypothetical protein
VGVLGRRTCATSATALLAMAVSVFATTCATLSWIPQSRRVTPQEYKDRVLATFRTVSETFDASGEGPP